MNDTLDTIKRQAKAHDDAATEAAVWTILLGIGCFVAALVCDYHSQKSVRLQRVARGLEHAAKSATKA